MELSFNLRDEVSFLFDLQPFDEGEVHTQAEVIGSMCRWSQESKGGEVSFLFKVLPKYPKPNHCFEYHDVTRINWKTQHGYLSLIKNKLIEGEGDYFWTHVLKSHIKSYTIEDCSLKKHIKTIKQEVYEGKEKG